MARAEMARYLNSEKRVLVRVVENLWEKYAVSVESMNADRAATIETLDAFLCGLGYRQCH